MTEQFFRNMKVENVIPGASRSNWILVLENADIDIRGIQKLSNAIVWEEKLETQEEEIKLVYGYFKFSRSVKVASLIRLGPRIIASASTEFLDINLYLSKYNERLITEPFTYKICYKTLSLIEDFDEKEFEENILKMEKLFIREQNLLRKYLEKMKVEKTLNYTNILTKYPYLYHRHSKFVELFLNDNNDLENSLEASLEEQEAKKEILALCYKPEEPKISKAAGKRKYSKKN